MCIRDSNYSEYAKHVIMSAYIYIETGTCGGNFRPYANSHACTDRAQHTVTINSGLSVIIPPCRMVNQKTTF